MQNAREAYDRLVEIGLAEERGRESVQEDARFVLPNAAETKIVVTMNARELRHFFRVRCCNRAQWEINRLAWACAVVLGVSPGAVRERAPVSRSVPEGRCTVARIYRR
jgi:thymidylate synthase (FAD)